LLVLVGLVVVAAGTGAVGIYLWTGYQYRATEKVLGRFDFNQAQQHLDLYLQVRPNDSSAHFLDAQTARRRGNSEEAARHLETVKRFQGVTAGTFLERVLQQAQDGKLGEVEQRLRPLFPKDDQDPSLIYEAPGQCYLAGFHLPEALHYLNTLLERQPNNVLGLTGRARVWQMWNQFDKAVADFQRAVDLHPELGRARLGLAENLNRVGQVREAVTQYEILHRRQPTDLEVLLRQAGCWEDLNQGKFPFVHHPLAPLYGAMRAVAADFTGKGQMDVLAVSYLPEEAFPQRTKLDLDSIIYLEQAAPGKFIRHSLEKTHCDHLTCVAGDLFGDGRIHFVSGNHFLNEDNAIPEAVDVWENLGPDPATKPGGK
jgi:tetratricopeptide (TPR) repeat protein